MSKGAVIASACKALLLLGLLLEFSFSKILDDNLKHVMVNERKNNYSEEND